MKHPVLTGLICLGLLPALAAAPSLARALHDAGYATGHFGKWHLGGQRDVGEAPLITQYGFDRSITNFEGLGDRFLPLEVAGTLPPLCRKSAIPSGSTAARDAVARRADC